MVIKTVDYSEVIEDSVLVLRKHLILFVPNIMLVLVSLLLFVLFFHMSGLSEMFIMNPYLTDDPHALSELFSSVSSTSQFVSALALFLILELFLSGFFLVMKFGMMRDVIRKGKTSLRSGAEFAEKNYFNFIVVHLATKAIIYIPLFVLLFIYFLVVKSSQYVFLSHFLMGLFGVVWFFYAVIMTMRLLFVYPVMTFGHDKYFKVIAHEFHYVKTHITHTVISFLIVLAVLFGYAFVRESVNIIGLKVQGHVIITMLIVISLLLEVIVTTWEHLFIFKSYNESRKIDRIVKESSKGTRPRKTAKTASAKKANKKNSKRISSSKSKSKPKKKTK
ncbi:MAG: hypothetical protein ACLFSL_03545 [Candidatus Woesearchaeota archaeon]